MPFYFFKKQKNIDKTYTELVLLSNFINMLL